MRACKSWNKRAVAGALAVSVLALGVSAYAQEVQWIPVSSTGPATISGNEIVIPAGGVRVEFEMFISGWGSRKVKKHDDPSQTPVGAAPCSGQTPDAAV